MPSSANESKVSFFENVAVKPVMEIITDNLNIQQTFVKLFHSAVVDFSSPANEMISNLIGCFFLTLIMLLSLKQDGLEHTSIAKKYLQRLPWIVWLHTSAFS